MQVPCLVGALAVSLLLAMSPACTTDGERPRREPAGDAAAGTTGYLAPPPCLECLESECSLQLGACEADTGCRDALACRARCSTPDCDDECVQRAEAEGGTSRASLESLSACATWSCSARCPPPPVGEGEVSECVSWFAEAHASLLPACADYRDCACRACTEELVACAGDATCTVLVGCFAETGCQGRQCRARCSSATLGLGPWTMSAIAAEACLQSRCEPCRTIDAGLP